MTRWGLADAPDQKGKTIIVTGGNSGLGFETALGLASKGATVALACRNVDKAREAKDRIESAHPRATVEVAALDLASLASIRTFAESFAKSHERLDVLCNNAGVMALPYRETADGFEMQFGTNHLGHFALTGLLLPLLLRTHGARIVNVSSTMHRVGRIHFDDLMGARAYSTWPAYSQSKLANLLFTYELQRRLEGGGKDAIAAAAHPGYAATNLQQTGPTMTGSKLMSRIMQLSNSLAAQDAATGALPTLYAATASGVHGGDYFGPGGFMEMWGPPKKVGSSKASHDRDAQRRLWQISEDLTGVSFGL